MNTKNSQKVKSEENENSKKESSSSEQGLVKNQLFDVGITNDTKKNILEFVIKSIKNSSENYYIVTPNPEILMYGMSHPQFQNILNKAKLALCDGVGLLIAGQLLGSPFKERFTGVDFVETLCEKVNDWPITVGFLGGKDKVAEMTAECLLKKRPQLKVVFVASEWDENHVIKGKEYLMKQNTNETGLSSHKSEYIDVLFVAYGFPKQEEWMAEHIDKVPVRVMVGVGGAFDYISGQVKRAPGPIRAVGFEWLFRLIRQPWRMKRQLALIDFMRLTISARFARSEA